MDSKKVYFGLAADPLHHGHINLIEKAREYGSLIVGLFFYILGRFKLGELVRYIPFPVVGGFLAGTGGLIVKFSFTMMTDLDLNLPTIFLLFGENIFLLWFPGFIFAVVLLLATRWFSHYLFTPGILFGGIILFYIICLL